MTPTDEIVEAMALAMDAIDFGADHKASLENQKAYARAAYLAAFPLIRERMARVADDYAGRETLAAGMRQTPQQTYALARAAGAYIAAHTIRMTQP
jgi:hypothetical protein